MLGNDTLIAYELFFFFSSGVTFTKKKKQADEVSKKQKCTNGMNFPIIATIHLVTSNSVKTLTNTTAYSKGANWVAVGFKFGLKHSKSTALNSVVFIYQI